MTATGNGGNRLVDSLPADERDALMAGAQFVQLRPGQVMAEAGQPLTHAYFPLNGMFSLVTVVEDGSMVEASTIGSEGMLGLQLALGVDSSTNLREMCQIMSDAIRIPADDLRRAVTNGSRLQGLLLRYAHALLLQAAQAVLCNRRHAAEQRCAKWLLLSHDRVGADDFHLTQEFLSQMLGVRRASVTMVASDLRKRGLIAYHRGAIRILDRVGLEAASCVCYGIIRQEYDGYLAAAQAAGTA